MYETESSRWRAVQHRDESAASAFIYAVITTKIFCRPSCPSRLARRANICFYDTVEDAVKAGYRACLRCKPDQAAASHLDNKAARKKAVDEACRYIEKSSTHVKFSDVAKHVNLSTRYLHGLFKEIMGITPAKYVELYRTCQMLDVESSASPASMETLSHPGVDLTLQSPGFATPDYTTGLDFGIYNSGLPAETAAQVLHTNACLYTDVWTASTGVPDSRLLPNDFDLFLDQSFTDTWTQSLPDQV